MAEQDGEAAPFAAFADGRGRVMASDSLSYANAGVGRDDVLVGASFAGIPTVALALGLGIKGLIAHEAGIGKDGAAIAGLALAQGHEVPAAAIATMTARLSDGRSLLAGTVAHANEAAAGFGVRPGQSGFDAARLMLAAPPGRRIDARAAFNGTVRSFESRPSGEILGAWSLSVVKEASPRAIFCVASHAARVMGEYAERIGARAVIANDAGFGLDRSGVDGLPYLDRSGTAAAAVATLSARLGDAASTWNDGVLSAVNRTAAARGVREGMTAKEAARRLADTAAAR